MPAAGDLQRLRRYWDKHARSYDKQLGFWDRRLFADTRVWICRQARGQVLEVAVGTGLTLDHHPNDVALTGVDLSPQMLAKARRRAHRLAWPVRGLQRLLEIATIPLGGKHFRRRPIRHAQDAGPAIQRRDRFTVGIVERLAAGKAQSQS